MSRRHHDFDYDTSSVDTEEPEVDDDKETDDDDDEDDLDRKPAYQEKNQEAKPRPRSHDRTRHYSSAEDEEDDDEDEDDPDDDDDDDKDNDSDDDDDDFYRKPAHQIKTRQQRGTLKRYPRNRQDAIKLPYEYCNGHCEEDWATAFREFKNQYLEPVTNENNQKITKKAHKKKKKKKKRKQKKSSGGSKKTSSISLLEGISAKRRSREKFSDRDAMVLTCIRRIMTKEYPADRFSSQWITTIARKICTEKTMTTTRTASATQPITAGTGTTATRTATSGYHKKIMKDPRALILLCLDEMTISRASMSVMRDMNSSLRVWSYVKKFIKEYFHTFKFRFPKIFSQMQKKKSTSTLPDDNSGDNDNNDKNEDDDDDDDDDVLQIQPDADEMCVLQCLLFLARSYLYLYIQQDRYGKPMEPCQYHSNVCNKYLQFLERHSIRAVDKATTTAAAVARPGAASASSGFRKRGRPRGTTKKMTTLTLHKDDRPASSTNSRKRGRPRGTTKATKKMKTKTSVSASSTTRTHHQNTEDDDDDDDDDDKNNEKEQQQQDGVRHYFAKICPQAKKVIEVFHSVRDLRRSLGLLEKFDTIPTGLISYLDGKKKHYMGYHWRHIVLPCNKIERVCPKTFKVQKLYNDIDEVKIDFPSLSITSFYDTLNGKTPNQNLFGYIWRFADKDDDEEEEEDFVFRGGDENRNEEERHKKKKRRKKGSNTNITESRWLQAVRHAKSFYRIRLFVDRARCKETDRYGQKPSLWALNHGMIVDGLQEILLEGSAAQINPSTRTVEASVLLQALQTNERPSTTSHWHWSMAKTFCAMKRGDIITMIIPGPNLKASAVFGVIEESFFHVRTIQDYESELNFPIPGDLADVYPTLLGRKVKWYRKCFVRDLPGQLISKKGDPYVNWILETSPAYLYDIPSTKYGTRDHLISTKFLQNSTCILQE